MANILNFPPDSLMSVFLKYFFLSDVIIIWQWENHQSKSIGLEAKSEPGARIQYTSPHENLR